MKGLFIPGITAEMFRSASLEGIEALMAEGEFCDIEYEKERKTRRWIWKTKDIYQCSECETEVHVAECMGEPIYNWCPYCGADMRGAES